MTENLKIKNEKFSFNRIFVGIKIWRAFTFDSEYNPQNVMIFSIVIN